MKNQLITYFILLLLIASTVYALPTSNNTTINKKTTAKNFTHTIYAEECTATWCPNCPFAREALYNIYQSGEYPFYYISLVDDMTSVAKNRNRDYSFGIYKIYAFPTVYFDGGDTNFVGRENTIEETENEYRMLIEQESQRTPKQPLTLESNITWEGDAQLTISLTVTNQGTFLYFGKLRSAVTEIESRWNDYTGNPYHFALLDYAINNIIFLPPGKTKTLIGTFDGKEDHGNQTYPDIIAENIMVISTISHWIPHYRLGYQSDQYTQRYFAYYIDQTTAATPN